MGQKKKSQFIWDGVLSQVFGENVYKKIRKGRSSWTAEVGAAACEDQ